MRRRYQKASSFIFGSSPMRYLPLIKRGVAKSPLNSYHGVFHPNIPRISRRSFINLPGTPMEEVMDTLQDGDDKDSKEHKDTKDSKSNQEKGKPKGSDAFKKGLETTAIMLSSLGMLALAGLIYHRGYKYHTFMKMESAFEGTDPAFQLRMHKKGKSDSGIDDIESGWVERSHQQLLDDVIAGKIVGRYYLIIGEKGTGKTSMILESMKKVEGRHCTYFDAHADPEIFRIRLGKALNFEYHEDYLGSLFSIRGPREGSALLDIERAFNTLETVAVRHVKKTGQPLVLVINSSHLIGNDEQGNNLVELLQQKAEALGGAGLVTMIFNSDDYWLYERLKRLGTRLEVVTINDFTREHAVAALKRARRLARSETVTDVEANNVYNLIGGRPQHIAAVAAQPNIMEACQRLIDKEKTWFLNQCGLLGEDMDDDVMESGKFSTSAMFLMKQMVEMDRERLSKASVDELTTKDHALPKIPLWRSRQIMTRPDYIQQYDNLNIFTMDSNSMVKPDSVPMMQAFHEIASMPGFDDLLAETADRVAAIESLGRTRELVAKDLVEGGKYAFRNGKSNERFVTLEVAKNIEDEDEGEEDNYQLDTQHTKDWWSKRMKRFKANEPKQIANDTGSTDTPVSLN